MSATITVKKTSSLSATDSARVFTHGSKLIESQATDASGNTGQIGGQSAKGNITNTTTSADPAVAAQAISAVADVSKQFGNQLSDFLSKTGQQSSATLQTALGSIGTLAQGQQTQTADTAASAATGGVSNYFKPALIGLAIVALVIIAVFWKKK